MRLLHYDGRITGPAGDVNGGLERVVSEFECFYFLGSGFQRISTSQSATMIIEIKNAIGGEAVNGPIRYQVRPALPIDPNPIKMWAQQTP